MSKIKKQGNNNRKIISRKGGIKMSNNLYKTKVSNLIIRAKEKGLVKKYSDFCKTECGRKHSLSEDEANYYTSRNKGENY